ncbi:MAG: hypothetical protein A2328_10685 [Bdellovibrionales bacterium RIFOXYB2_FULL_36_6]|nr:MAG: hypothetical protein A2328_10685 [Bdellovibrionales bacterium RIFOXYB2_FULL_36_6]
MCFSCIFVNFSLAATVEEKTQCTEIKVGKQINELKLEALDSQYLRGLPCPEDDSEKFEHFKTDILPNLQDITFREVFKDSDLANLINRIETWDQYERLLEALDKKLLFYLKDHPDFDKINKTALYKRIKALEESFNYKPGLSGKVDEWDADSLPNVVALYIANINAVINKIDVDNHTVEKIKSDPDTFIKDFNKLNKNLKIQNPANLWSKVFRMYYKFLYSEEVKDFILSDEFENITFSNNWFCSPIDHAYSGINPCEKIVEKRNYIAFAIIDPTTRKLLSLVAKDEISQNIFNQPVGIRYIKAPDASFGGRAHDQNYMVVNLFAIDDQMINTEQQNNIIVHEATHLIIARMKKFHERKELFGTPVPIYNSLVKNNNVLKDLLSNVEEIENINTENLNELMADITSIVDNPFSTFNKFFPYLMIPGQKSDFHGIYYAQGKIFKKLLRKRFHLKSNTEKQQIFHKYKVRNFEELITKPVDQFFEMFPPACTNFSTEGFFLARKNVEIELLTRVNMNSGDIQAISNDFLKIGQHLWKWAVEKENRK